MRFRLAIYDRQTVELMDVPTDSGGWAKIVDVPDELLARYQAADEAWRAVQDEIEDLTDATPPAVSP